MWTRMMWLSSPEEQDKARVETKHAISTGHES
jgi:hypothetical protein